MSFSGRVQTHKKQRRSNKKEGNEALKKNRRLYRLDSIIAQAGWKVKREVFGFLNIKSEKSNKRKMREENIGKEERITEKGGIAIGPENRR